MVAGQTGNVVFGFQTGLKWGEQRRVFSMIPGLEHAEFVRFGVMHRNTSVNAPAVLDAHLRPLPLGRGDLFLAGQITGVEGYMESTAMGLVAGVNAARLLEGLPLPEWPGETAVGSLLRYLRTADPRHFQPMNTNLGLFPPLAERIRNKRERAAAFAASRIARFGPTRRSCVEPVRRTLGALSARLMSAVPFSRSQLCSSVSVGSGPKVTRAARTQPPSSCSSTPTQNWPLK